MGSQEKKRCDVKRKINALVHGKVLFNFSLSSSADFRTTVVVRMLFRVFHNGDNNPVQKTGCCNLKF